MLSQTRQPATGSCNTSSCSSIRSGSISRRASSSVSAAGCTRLCSSCIALSTGLLPRCRRLPRYVLQRDVSKQSAENHDVLSITQSQLGIALRFCHNTGGLQCFNFPKQRACFGVPKNISLSCTFQASGAEQARMRLTAHTHHLVRRLVVIAPSSEA